MQLALAVLSDTGRVRSNNEDSAFIDPATGLAIVADGMGGHAGGHVASEVAVTVVADSMRRMDRRARIQEDAVVRALQDAVFAANDHILAKARQDPELFDMGTTLVACAFLANRVVTANVGDSRIYRIADGAIVQVSEDHSLVAERVKEGLLDPKSEEARMLSNIVTRALGMDQVQVDITVEDLAPGDTYLLCSDGLSDLVEPEEMAAAVTAHGADLQGACLALVDLANARGGPDNVTVVLARAG